MGGVVRAHYLMCEYLITKSDMGLTEDHQDRSVGPDCLIISFTMRKRLTAQARQSTREASDGRVV
jgi:hypothetical protein